MSGFRGAVFDVDGVLVDSPHERAWRQSLEALMEGEWKDVAPRTSWSPDAFTSRVYQQAASGKPRLDGARAVLEHFGVPDAAGRAREYGERKQRLIVELIERGEFRGYDDARRFEAAVRAAGIRAVAASSSRNAGRFLDKLGLELDADVSGRHVAHGKPAPDLFLLAARELGLPPRECFVVEDAASGVQAAKAGGMQAIGVARAGDADALHAAGADLVVTSLDDVDVDALDLGKLARRSP